MSMPPRASVASSVGDPLGQHVRTLFRELSHAGDLSEVSQSGQLSGPLRHEKVPGAVLQGQAGQVAQGTRVRFSLRVAGHRIVQARYRAYGCPYTLATCEWLARRLEGAELPQLTAEGLSVRIGFPADWAATLGVPAERLGRLLVIEDALHAALKCETDRGLPARP
jgi:hypothetical protein